MYLLCCADERQNSDSVRGVIGMRESLSDFCIRTGREELLEQWAAEENLPLTPAQISYGSKRKVWWQCERGHRWQAAVHTRTGRETGCPVCAGSVPLAGETSLAARYPRLAGQWHPTKNGALTPEQVLPGSHRTAWWRCERGHVWRASVKSRVSGCGCPVCAGRRVIAGENDLASRFPHIAGQWHPTKNGALTPEQVAPATHRKVWWRCERGHEWQASVASRTTGGNGCPVCAGRAVIPGENDLASRFPQIAAQWHPTKNGALTPRQVTPYANRRVWWRCPRGHEYRAVVGGRTMGGSGCPYCAGRRALAGFNDLATVRPELAKQWHPTLNGALTPEMVTPGSHRRVWWQCAQGHVWQAAVYARAGKKGSGCPVCAGHVSPRRLERYGRMTAEEREAVQV